MLTKTKNTMGNAVICLFILVVSAVLMGAFWSNTFRAGTNGTIYTLIKTVEIVSADDSTYTATVPVAPAAGYRILGASFKTNSANTYIRTIAISSTTLTATTNAATTGTLNVTYAYLK